MNKLFTKIAGVTLGFAMAIGVGVAANASKHVEPTHAIEKTAIACDFSTKGTSHSSYKDTWDWKNSTSEPIWKINYGANNNAGWAFVKLGSKSADNKLNGCYIGSPQVDKAVSRIAVKVLSNTGSNTGSMGVASWSLGVYSDSSYSTAIATVDKSSTAISITSGSTYDVVPTSGDSWASNSYYKLIFNLTNTSSTNGVLWIESVTFYYNEATDEPSVTFSDPKDSVGVGASVTNTASGENLGTATISYSSSNTSAATVNATTGEVTGVAFGTSTITAKATVDNVDYTDSYTISVTSSENAYYTIAQARAAIDSGKGLANQYVKGIVYKVDNYDSTRHQITYWISDDGANTVPFEVYGGLGIGGADFESIDDIHLGDIVVVKGELKKSGSIYEFNYQNQLVSQISISSIAVKTAPTKVEYDQGESFDPTGLVVTATYNDNPATTHDYAYADLGTAFTFNPSTSTALTDEESVTITLFGKSTTQAITVAGRTITGVTVTGDMTNKTYVKDADWDFTGLSLTVAYDSGDPSVIALEDLTVGTDFNVDKAKADGSTSLTISGTYEEAPITSRTITGISYVSTVTLDATVDSADASPLTKYGLSLALSNGILNNGSEYRIYKNSTATLTSSGENIRKIEFTGTSSNPISGMVLTSGGGELTYDGYDGTWLGDAKTIVFTASVAQARASKIVITTDSGYAEVHVDGLSVDGNAATIGQEFNVEVVKGKTHQLNVAVTPDNTTDSKDIAYSVYSGTGATVDNKGVITAGTTVGDTAVIKAESVADPTYYVYFNVTIADSKTVYHLTFKNSSSGDSGTAVTTSTWANFTEGDDNDLTCTATDKVYPSSNTMMKFSSSSAAGTITLKTPNETPIGRVVIHAKTFGTDSSAVTVNSGTAQSLTDEFKYYVFDLATASDSVTIAAASASKCRFYVDDVMLLGSENEAAVGAYGYAATFMNALDEECGNLAVTTATWGTLNTAWTTLGNANGEQDFFLDKTASASGDAIQKSLSRYDYIVGKYNKGQGLTDYNDFMNRDPAAIAGSNYQIAINDSNDTAILIVVIAIASISTFGCLLLLKKKRKHQ